MVDSSAYLCFGFLFVIFVVLFAVSMRTTRRTRSYCQASPTPAPATTTPPISCTNECDKKADKDAYKKCKNCIFKKYWGLKNWKCTKKCMIKNCIKPYGSSSATMPPPLEYRTKICKESFLDGRLDSAYNCYDCCKSSKSVALRVQCMKDKEAAQEAEYKKEEEAAEAAAVHRPLDTRGSKQVRKHVKQVKHVTDSK